MIKNKLKLFALTGSALMMLTSCHKTKIDEPIMTIRTNHLENTLDSHNLNDEYLVFDTTDLPNLRESNEETFRFHIIKVGDLNDNVARCSDLFYTDSTVSLYSDDDNVNIHYIYSDKEIYFGNQNNLKTLNAFLEENGYTNIKEKYTDEEIRKILSYINNNSFRHGYDLTHIIVFDSDDDTVNIMVSNYPGYVSNPATFYHIKDHRTKLCIDWEYDYVDYQYIKDCGNFEISVPISDLRAHDFNEYLIEKGYTPKDYYTYNDLLKYEIVLNIKNKTKEVK